MKKVSVMIRAAIFTAIAIGLSGCGGSGSDGVTEEPPLPPLPPLPTVQERFDARLDQGAVLSDAVFGNGDDFAGLSGTQFAQVPTNASATFNGAAAISTAASTAPLARAALLVADASLTVDFAKETFSGTLSDFLIVSGTDQALRENLDALPAVEGTGTVTLTGGQFLDPERNLFNSVGYFGDIVAGDQTYQLVGIADGKFYGTRPQAPAETRIKALALADFDGTVFVNGEAWGSFVTIVGETN